VSVRPTRDDGRMYCGSSKIQSTTITAHEIGDGPYINSLEQICLEQAK
jgi:hypothetical protein